MEKQRTIKKVVSLEGIGLHSGKRAVVKINPAPPSAGINFVRLDLPGNPTIPANISQAIDVSERPRRTSLASDGAEVQTIEHLMATLYALGIDNALIEVDGPEIPGLDGSALGFLEVLKKAGAIEQNLPRRFFRVREPVGIDSEEASLVILPSEKLKISYTLNYDHPLLKAQYADLVFDEKVFEKEIAPSRTFCLEEEVETLKAQGLGKGADYENTVVMGERGVIDNRLRFEDEFVRHKVLDLVGDLYLLGYFILGHVIAIRSGHSLNLRLLKQISLKEGRVRTAAVGISQAIPVEGGGALDSSGIQKILPHRYPFLLIDKILELEEDRRAVGIKNVTINDNFFAGHFPGRPVMPGVLVIEAMAQVAGVLMLNKEENVGKLAYFMGMNNVKFRRTVVPGDQLRIEVEVKKLKSKTGQVYTRALVEDKIVAEADLLFSLVEA